MLLLNYFRFSILDVILRVVEALSTIDGYSQEISSNKELFQLVSDLVKLPDKVEVKCILLKTDCGLINTVQYLFTKLLELLFYFAVSSKCFWLEF